MIDVSSARVARCAVHRVGNRVREEGYLLSEGEVRGTGDLHGTLLRNYLAPLAKSDDEFEFYHESDISLNALRRFSGNVFEDPASFLRQTQNIAKSLYSASTHPQISGGEFIAILFNDVRVEGRSIQSLGLYRIEAREPFLDVVQINDRLNLVEKSGIPVTSIQKGALILDRDFDVRTRDTSAHETKYWLEAFLKVRRKRTEKGVAHAAAALIKEACARVGSESGIALRKDVRVALDESDSVSFGAIAEVAERYLPQAEVQELNRDLERQFGFSISPQLTLDSGLLGKKTKSIIRQFPIDDGISLAITNPHARLGRCTLQKTRIGIRAVIDIEFGGA